MPLQDPLIQTVRRRLLKMRIPPTSRIGVGVSGGADSMVLLHVLDALGYQTLALHVNFQLRGEESAADARFVTAWCNSRGIPCRVYDADTLAHKSAYQLNTQEAARDIRYTWWENLHTEGAFDFLATGHHLDDNIETLWMRLLRGTGTSGLQGIPERRDFVIRPMLDLAAADIRAFAAGNGISYREDSSNQSDAYLRNKIRRQLLPLLDTLAPGHRAAMRHNITRWQAERASWTEMSPLCVEADSGTYRLSCPAAGIAWLCEWLESKGVPWTLSYEYLSAPAGTGRPAMHYGTWQLTRDGADRYVFHELAPDSPAMLEGPGMIPIGDRILTAELADRPADLQATGDGLVVYMNPGAIEWPLTIRHVRPGDKLRPLGMHGHAKRLQDLLTDEKVTPYARTAALVVLSGPEIIWVPGLRMADHVKVNPEDKQVLCLRLRPVT